MRGLRREPLGISGGAIWGYGVGFEDCLGYLEGESGVPGPRRAVRVLLGHLGKSGSLSILWE